MGNNKPVYFGKERAWLYWEIRHLAGNDKPGHMGKYKAWAYAQLTRLEIFGNKKFAYMGQ